MLGGIFTMSLVAAVLFIIVGGLLIFLDGSGRVFCIACNATIFTIIGVISLIFGVIGIISRLGSNPMPGRE